MSINVSIQIWISLTFQVDVAGASADWVLRTWKQQHLRVHKMLNDWKLLTYWFKKHSPETTLVTLVMVGWLSITLVTLVTEGWLSMTLVTLVMEGSAGMTLVTLVTSGPIKATKVCFTRLQLQLAQHCPSIQRISHLYANGHITNGPFTGSERLLWQKCDS